jgi:hypothetical protein
MEPGLKISVVDPDDDYLGLEVRAANRRVAGTARIFARFDELSALAQCIEGFPTADGDEREFELGHRDRRIAGGFARLRFHCVGRTGDVKLEVELEDDPRRNDPESVQLVLRFEAAALDRFTRQLRGIEKERSGSADLPAAV